MYVDLDNFKAFNDRFGFTRGDDVIRFAGMQLRQSANAGGGEGDFVGHVGGDDFVIVTEPSRVEAIGRTLIASFDRDVRQFYAEEDRAAGCVTLPDRDGRLRTFAFVSLSVAVVATSVVPIPSYGYLGERAARVKKKAKAVDGSALIWDAAS